MTTQSEDQPINQIPGIISISSHPEVTTPNTTQKEIQSTNPQPTPQTVKIETTDENSIIPTPVDTEDDLHETSEEEISPSTTEETEQPTKFRLFLESLDKDSLSVLLRNRQSILGVDAFQRSAGTPDTYENLIMQLIDDHSIESDRVGDSISRVKEKTLFSNRLVREGKTVLGTMVPKKASGKGVKLSGKDARAAISIRTGRTKRVPLYNSGFCIDIAQPSLGALNSFFTEAQDKTNSYGRQLGGYFFFFHTLLIKEAIVKLISPLILNSNLQNWNRESHLLRHIRLSDLRMILNAMGALMFPEGTSYTHICQNPSGECSHTEELVVDVNKFVKYDFGKMSDSAISHMSKQEEVTQASLASYHKNLGFDGRTVRYKKWELTLQNPTISEYLEYGRIFNATLLKDIFVDNSDAVRTAIRYSYYQILTPYVSELTLYDDNNEIDMSTKDKEVISEVLSHIQEEDIEETVLKNIKDFISDSEIGYLCYPSRPCPVCNYQPGSGFYQVDPEYSFFMLSLKKLLRIS